LAGTLPANAAVVIPATFGAIGFLAVGQLNAILAFYGVAVPAGATDQDKRDLVLKVLIGDV
jgi:hypothetical protein